MKAAVLHGAKDIRVEDVPYPSLEPHSVIIRVKACGVCGSDLHRYRLGVRDPMRLGHEFSGDVVEVGAEVTGVKQGDRVVAMSGRGCGQCYWCRQGDFIRCSKLALLGYGVPGAFAEYVSVPFFRMGQYAAILPSHLTYEEGATAEPVSVALHAVRQMQPKPDDTVLVIGLGIIGLCIIPILKSWGIARVIASGRRGKRLQLARDMGADSVVDAATGDVLPVVAEITSGRGADIVYECAGTADTFQQALRATHRGGKINVLGLYEQPFSWNPSALVSNDVTLVGCGLRWDLPGAIQLLQSSALDTKPLISHRFPLDKVKEAFEAQVGADDAIKVIVKP